MQWVVYTQLLLLLLFLSPGVISIGSAYAVFAQLYLFAATTWKTNNKWIINAARINTGVALANIVLQILVWRSTDNMLSSAAAAFRAAVFSVGGFAMITTSEYIMQQQEEEQQRAEAAAQKKKEELENNQDKFTKLLDKQIEETRKPIAGGQTVRRRAATVALFNPDE